MRIDLLHAAPELKWVWHPCFRDYCVIFKPFTMSLNILQVEQNACIGFLLPVLAKLKTTMSLAEQSSTSKPLAKALIEGIEKRFSDDFKNPNSVLVAVLSPIWLDKRRKGQKWCP